jgi:hypothetical protein
MKSKIIWIAIKRNDIQDIELKMYAATDNSDENLFFLVASIFLCSHVIFLFHMIIPLMIIAD